MEKIFVDSNYFIALAHEHDTNHDQALLVADMLEADNPPLVISNYVFSEIVTVLSQRVSREVAYTVGEELITQPRTEIIVGDEILDERAWTIFREQNRKNLSFVDCHIIATMRFVGVKKLVTFDETDFDGLQATYGFRILSP